MQTRIRNATSEDALVICDVLRQSISACCGADHHGDPEVIAGWLANKTANNVGKWITAEGAIALVAYWGGTAVGFALVVGDELALCYVTPQVLHQGVGKALLQEAVSRARAQGVSLLRLDSTRTALAFYLRHGFSVTGPSKSWAGLEAQPMARSLVTPSVFQQPTSGGV